MSTKTVYQKIALEKIDMEDRSFSLSPTEETLSEEFRQSIGNYGIIHPPLLLERDGRYLVVSGRKRLRGATEVLGLDHCYCLVFPPDTTEARALALALEDIRTDRPLSPAEEAICWKKARRILGDQARVKFGPLLVITDQLSPSKLEELPDLDQEILEALDKGKINLKTVSRLLEMDSESRLQLSNITTILHLSHSNQRKLVDQCLELSKRHKKTVAELLSAAELRVILDHPETNPPQKTALLMNWLKKLCHPRLSEAEKDYGNFVRALDLPVNVTIDHARSFENDSLKVTIEFRDRQELEKKWQALKDILPQTI